MGKQKQKIGKRKNEGNMNSGILEPHEKQKIIEIIETEKSIKEAWRHEDMITGTDIEIIPDAINEILEIEDIKTSMMDFKRFKKKNHDQIESAILNFLKHYYKKQYSKYLKNSITKKELIADSYVFHDGTSERYDLLQNHAILNGIKKIPYIQNTIRLSKYINMDILGKMLYGDAEDTQQLKNMGMNITPLNYVKRGLIKYALKLKGYQYLQSVLRYGMGNKKFYRMTPEQKNSYLLGYIQQAPNHMTNSRLLRLIMSIAEIEKSDRGKLKTILQILDYERQRLHIIRRFKPSTIEIREMAKRKLLSQIGNIYKRATRPIFEKQQQQKPISDCEPETTIRKMPDNERSLLAWYFRNSGRFTLE